MQKGAKARPQNTVLCTGTFLVLLGMLVGAGLLSQRWQHERLAEMKQLRQFDNS